mmetsp:Transcript_30571/g.72768  ORF Transcript_30571/g.72768 Transcript_30571/m.72768 type:complete len:312 (+) Transcript_30571:367-1302(+)
MSPKKKGASGKKGKKKKGPAFYTAPEDTEPFGFKVNDIVRTPVGLTGTVIGVKYDDPNNKETGRLWVEYFGGKRSPLEPRLGAGFIGTLGYRRAPEAEHIRRDVDTFNQKLREMEERRCGTPRQALTFLVFALLKRLWVLRCYRLHPMDSLPFAFGTCSRGLLMHPSPPSLALSGFCGTGKRSRRSTDYIGRPWIWRRKTRKRRKRLLNDRQPDEKTPAAPPFCITAGTAVGAELINASMRDWPFSPQRFRSFDSVHVLFQHKVAPSNSLDGIPCCCFCLRTSRISQMEFLPGSYLDRTQCRRSLTCLRTM